MSRRSKPSPEEEVLIEEGEWFEGSEIRESLQLELL